MPAQRTAAQAYVQTADWFASQGQPEQAAALYRTAGAAAESHGDYRAALAAFASAERLEGQGSSATAKVARMHEQLGDHRTAADAYERAALAEFAAGRPQAGLHAMHSAARAAGDAERWLRLSEWCVRLGKPGDAFGYLERAASELFTRANANDFIAVANKLLQFAPGHVPTLRRLVRAHLQRREIQPAVGAIQALLRARPGDADALEQMATAFAGLGRLDKAAEVAARLARRFVQEDAAEEARRVLDRGLAWCSNHPDLIALRQELAGEALQPSPQPLVVADDTPPLDLTEFADITPTEDIDPMELDAEDIEAVTGEDEAIDRYADAGGTDPSFSLAALGLG